MSTALDNFVCIKAHMYIVCSITHIQGYPSCVVLFFTKRDYTLSSGSLSRCVLCVHFAKLARIVSARIELYIQEYLEQTYKYEYSCSHSNKKK